MNAEKILFAGTPEFALVSLRTLVDAGHVPLAVLTQPDRPAGRGKKLSASPLKTFALAANIPVWQPQTLKDPDVVKMIAELAPDIIIVAAYGLILPQNILDIPRHGCLNVHASLLPRWRGAAPVQQAILAGDSKTGISLMQMEAGLDCGAVFAQSEISIGAQETAGELHDRLALLGGELLLENLAAILAGNLTAVPQDETSATYAGKIRTPHAAINWADSAAANRRKIRAYNPLPGAFFDLEGTRIKCWQAVACAEITNTQSETLPPGTVVAAGRDGIDVVCGQGILRLLVLQRPGGKRVTAAEFSAVNNSRDSLPGKVLR